MLVLAEPPRSASPANSGNYANVPEMPTNESSVPETPSIAPAPESSTTAPPEVMSHAEDYTWLKGTLEYMHADSGHWKVRYAPLSEEDTFGGSVVLDTDV